MTGVELVTMRAKKISLRPRWCVMCVWCGLRRDVANRDWVRSLTEVASRRGERGEEVWHYGDPHKCRANDTTTHEQKGQSSTNPQNCRGNAHAIIPKDGNVCGMCVVCASPAAVSH